MLYKRFQLFFFYLTHADRTMRNLRVSRPLTFTAPTFAFGWTSTLNGDLGTSWPAKLTLTLCGPCSVGVNVVPYPSGFFCVGSSTTLPLGLVTVTLQGASGLPVDLVLIVTGRGSPTSIAIN